MSGDIPSQAPRRRVPDPLFHAVLLIICTAVMILATTMSIRGSTKVVLPGMSGPVPELCMLRRYTGISCPGCGFTRCFISLAHGDVRSAWSYNPAGLLMFAIVAFQIPYRSVQIWRTRRGLPELSTGWLGQAAFAVLGVMMIGQWLLRQAGVDF